MPGLIFICNFFSVNNPRTKYQLRLFSSKKCQQRKNKTASADCKISRKEEDRREGPDASLRVATGCAPTAREATWPAARWFSMFAPSTMTSPPRKSLSRLNSKTVSSSSRSNECRDFYNWPRTSRHSSQSSKNLNSRSLLTPRPASTMYSKSSTTSMT